MSKGHESLAVERRDADGNIVDDAGRLLVKHSWRSKDVQKFYPENLFTPDAHYSESGGSVEAARAQADNANKTIGKLLAVLHEKQILTAQQCLEIADKTEWELQQ